MDKLINVGLVEKKKCITDEKNKKKTQYVLKDYMFKFWYEFIPKGTSVIEMGQGELYYQKAVKPILHSFMGTVFEKMCRYYTADIDVVGISDIDKKAVIGECKFKNEKIDKDVYETLVRRGKVIAAKYKVSKYIFFSLSGYTEWVENLKDEDLLLLTLDSLYE